MHPLLRYTLDLFESLGSGAAPQASKTKPARKRPAPDLRSSSLPAPGSAAAGPSDFSHPQATRQLRLGGVTVAFSLVRAKRHTIGMVVGPDGLAVRAPRWTSLHEIDSALQARADWIVRKLQEVHARHTRLEQTRIEWRDGAVFPYLGAPLRLQLDPAHRFASVGAALEMAADGTGTQVLRLALAPDASAAQIRDACQAWLMRQARILFAQRLDHFAPQLQVRWSRLSLSNAGTRWGSAKSDGSIRLHWRLMHFDLAVIDYVVAHELSHLRVMNHSPAFWDTVQSVLPDYPALRRELKQERLPAW
jgi:predicted metal-dependent hydrolase